MFRKSLVAVVLIVSLTAPLVGKSGDMHTAVSATTAPELALSPKLRAALVAEMMGVKEGVAELSTFLATGEWNAAAQRAERIRDSFIMKQKLSRDELEELERALPVEFVELDEAFHRHADGLAHAAKAMNYELAIFYYSKMMDGCGNCHSRYATNVFKGFK